MPSSLKRLILTVLGAGVVLAVGAWVYVVLSAPTSALLILKEQPNHEIPKNMTDEIVAKLPRKVAEGLEEAHLSGSSEVRLRGSAEQRYQQTMIEAFGSWDGVFYYKGELIRIVRVSF